MGDAMELICELAKRYGWRGEGAYAAGLFVADRLSQLVIANTPRFTTTGECFDCGTHRDTHHPQRTRYECMVERNMQILIQREDIRRERDSAILERDESRREHLRTQEQLNEERALTRRLRKEENYAR